MTSTQAITNAFCMMIVFLILSFIIAVSLTATFVINFTNWGMLPEDPNGIIPGTLILIIMWKSFFYIDDYYIDWLKKKE